METDPRHNKERLNTYWEARGTRGGSWLGQDIRPACNWLLRVNMRRLQGSFGVHTFDRKLLVGVSPVSRALLAGESMTYSVVVVLQLPALLPVHQKQACHP